MPNPNPNPNPTPNPNPKQVAACYHLPSSPVASHLGASHLGVVVSPRGDNQPSSPDAAATTTTKAAAAATAARLNRNGALLPSAVATPIDPNSVRCAQCYLPLT